MTQGNGQPLMAWPGAQAPQNMMQQQPSASPPFQGGQLTTPPPDLNAATQAAEKTVEQAQAELKAAKEQKKAQKAVELEARRNWATPGDRFAAWHAEFQFTLDLSANEQNHKTERWIGPGSPLGVYDALMPSLVLPGESIWNNPPGFDWEFTKLAWRLMGGEARTRPVRFVQLRPANQTDQPIWAELVEQYRDWNGYTMMQSIGLDFRVRFLSPRVEHVPPPGIKASTPTSGHCLLIWTNLWAQQPPRQS